MKCKDCLFVGECKDTKVIVFTRSKGEIFYVIPYNEEKCRKKLIKQVRNDEI